MLVSYRWFCIFSVLIILDYVVPFAAVAFEKFFELGIIFIQRWLPLFYVPYLVVLPLSLKDIPASSTIKICFIVGIDYWTSSYSYDYDAE